MIETRWNISDPILLRDRNCYTCNDIEDVQCMIAFDKKYILLYFRKYPSMYKFIALRNVSNVQFFKNIFVFL